MWASMLTGNGSNVPNSCRSLALRVCQSSARLISIDGHLWYLPRVAILLHQKGVRSLALRKGLSGTADVPELRDMWKAFEQQNSVEIQLDARLMDYHGKVDLVWTAVAWDTDPMHSGATILASVRFGCLEKRLVSMEAVLMQLLYALDFQLAERVFNRVIADS